MVQVINVTGIAAVATAAIDLTNYVPDNIARLIGVKSIARLTQTVTFTGSAVAAHSHAFTGSAVGAHDHMLSAARFAPATAPVTSATLWISGAVALIQASAAAPSGGFRSEDAGGHTPSGAIGAGGALTPVGTISSVLGIVHTGYTLVNNGLLTTSMPGAGSAALTGRKEVRLGDALASNAMLEIQALLFREAGGVF